VDIDQEDMGSENITEPAKRTPFSFETHLDTVSESKITKGFYKGDKVKYAEAEIEAGMILYYCPTYHEGVRAALGYRVAYLKWDQNPWFDQKHFNIIALSAAGFTERVDHWVCRGQLTVNFDTQKWSPHYTSYDLFLWGRYSYCEHIGVHVGCFAETGLHMDRVSPVIGFDWQFSRRWKVNLIYPFNLSLIYSFSPGWSTGLAGRLFSSRYRVHHQEHSAKPLVRYTNVGAEFILEYEDQRLSANLHAGSTLGGTFRVANRRNRHARNYHLDPSAYLGAEIDVKF